MKNRISSKNATFSVVMSFFLLLAINCFGQQGKKAIMKMNAANKTEIFTVEVTVEGNKSKIVQLVELYAVTSTGEQVLGLTYDDALVSKAKTFNTDSTFLVIEGPLLDDARILQIQMEFGNMFRESEKFITDSIKYYQTESEKFLTDSIKYYQKKHPELKRRTRKKNEKRLTVELKELRDSNKKNEKRLTIELNELRASNKRNFDFLKTILTVRKGKSFVVYNYDVQDRYKLIQKVKKTSG